MKKTTLALLASALVANSASALTVFDSKETGTKVDFTGSARLKWTSVSDDSKSNKHVNEAVRNNHSRFGFKVTQQLGNGFYALGRVEWRFRGEASSQHDFDHIYTRQLYAGIGHKQYGELVYGNLTTITDEVKQTDLPNTLSLSDGLLVSPSRRTVQYTYQGIDGLKVGAYYGASSPRDNTGLSYSANKDRKDIWGGAAIYKHKFDDVNSVKVAAGVSRERYNQPNLSAYDRTAYAFGVAYKLYNTTLGMDLERRVTNDQNALGNKRSENEARFLVHQALTDQWNAYTMYAYKTDKTDYASLTTKDIKAKKHQFMLGTEYYIVPKYLKGFVEWQATRTRNYSAGVKTTKSHNYTTVVGLRAYW